ncbi:MAG: hypothetical protein ABR579_06440 [Actinomycetota bacterium]
MKKLIAIAALAALAGVACGSSGNNQPASFGATASPCATVPVTVPGISVLGQKIVGQISNLTVCVRAEAGVGGTIVSVTKQADCGDPCMTVEAEDFNVSTDEALSVSYDLDKQPAPSITYDPPPVTAGQQISHICVVGIGGPPDPCSARVLSPQSLAASPHKGKVALTWQAASTTGNNNVVSYDIWRSTSGQAGTFSLVGSTATTSFTDTTATKAILYYYFVVANDDQGNHSPQSNTAKAKPKACPKCPAPSPSPTS